MAHRPHGTGFTRRSRPAVARREKLEPTAGGDEEAERNSGQPARTNPNLSDFTPFRNKKTTHTLSNPGAPSGPTSPSRSDAPMVHDQQDVPRSSQCPKRRPTAISFSASSPCK